MADQISAEHLSNYEQFRDILSVALIERFTAPSHKPKAKAKAKRRSKRQPPHETTHPPDDVTEPPSADDLADFTAYIATTTFLALPEDLQSLTYRRWADDASLQSKYTPLPLPRDRVSALLQSLDPSIPDSLAAYGLLPSSPDPSPGGGTATNNNNNTNGTTTTTTTTITTTSSTTSEASEVSEAAASLLAPVLSSYIEAQTTPPPPPASTRALASACEICGRDWINLSYHHLIPRMVHDKVVKRGWHHPDDLQNVAWLCGACHRFVHRFAPHEELARRFYTVERLLEAEEVRRFAAWVGRLRWKKR
ncbi:hypothetical protein VTK26DRAFT_5369 [Humicola hyalothermophila]